MTYRTVVIDIDTPMGNKLYWFLKELQLQYPTVIVEKKKGI